MSKPWYVADPVHQFVEVGEDYGDVVRELVATLPFQRLRRISQLGLASFVFPCAVHSRFSHSLGAAHLAAQLVTQLKVPPDQARAVVCAALLHDVGHGPFSHSFEHAVRQVFPNGPKHEEWTKAIIRGSLREILARYEVDADLVCDLISGSSEGVPVPAYLRQVISSQLDVDRMDYLCRDAHFTGVPIGQVDLPYLIKNIRTIDHGGEQTLGITEKGVSSFEAFAFARHVMTRMVYHHKQVATFETMMEEFIRLLVAGDRLDAEPELVRLLRDVATDRCASLVEVLLSAYVKTTEDQIWTAVSASAEGTGSLGVLARRLLERSPVPSFLINKHTHDLLDRNLRSGGFRQDQYRIRTLQRNLYKQSSGEQVFVAGPRGRAPVHITSKSSLVTALGDQTDTEAILVIFDKSALRQIRKVAKESHCLELGDSMPPSRPPVKVREEHLTIPARRRA